jgi:hypothetical protein
MNLVQGALVEEPRRTVITHKLRVHFHEVRGPEYRLGFGRANNPHALVPGSERLLDVDEMLKARCRAVNEKPLQGPRVRRER